MARQWRLLFIALLLALTLFKSVTAYYDDDDDDNDNEDEEEYYHEEELDYGLFHHRNEEIITNTFTHTITIQQQQIIPVTTESVVANPSTDESFNGFRIFGLESAKLVEGSTCSDKGLTNEIVKFSIHNIFKKKS